MGAVGLEFVVEIVVMCQMPFAKFATYISFDGGNSFMASKQACFSVKAVFGSVRAHPTSRNAQMIMENILIAFDRVNYQKFAL